MRAWGSRVVSLVKKGGTAMISSLLRLAQGDFFMHRPACGNLQHNLAKEIRDMFNADELKKTFLDDIESAKSEIQLSDVWKKYLGKGGSVQKLMNGIKEVAKEEKKAYGQFVNEVKVWVQEKYDEKKAEVEAFELKQRYEKEIGRASCRERV